MVSPETMGLTGHPLGCVSGPNTQPENRLCQPPPLCAPDQKHRRLLCRKPGSYSLHRRPVPSTHGRAVGALEIDKTTQREQATAIRRSEVYSQRVSTSPAAFVGEGCPHSTKDHKPSALDNRKVSYLYSGGHESGITVSTEPCSLGRVLSRE